MTEKETDAVRLYKRFWETAEEWWPMDDPDLTVEESLALLKSWPLKTHPAFHAYLTRRHGALLDRTHTSEKENTR